MREDELIADVLGFVYKCKCWWWQKGLCSVRMSASKQQISFLFYSKPIVLYGFGYTMTRGQILKSVGYRLNIFYRFYIKYLTDFV